MRKAIVLGLLLATAVAACGDAAHDDAATAAPTSSTTEPNSGSPDGGPASIPTTESRNVEERAADDDDLPEPVPSSTTAAPITGRADSDLVASIKQDLVDRIGADEADIVVIRAEEVIWNDGSLGCPVPGEIYTQALVNGYWVVLDYGGQTYDYRATGTGYFRLCQGSETPPSNPTG